MVQLNWPRSLTRYCVLAAIAAALGGLVIAGLVTLLVTVLGVDPKTIVAPSYSTPWRLIGAIVFAPVVETFLLAGLLKLLVSWEFSRTRACVISALIWGVVHMVNHPVAFLGAAWGFLVFGAGYLLWRPVSFRHAFVAAAVPHALANAALLAVMRASSAG